MFKDHCLVTISAGKGGNGIVAWRREKYIPKGGPYGGDGGDGGSIILEVDSHLLSLEKFRNKKIIKAEDGKSGGINNRKGKNGSNLTIKVPLGTIIKDLENDEILFEFTDSAQKFLVCQGGKGGKGNTRFKSSTNRAPNICTEGRQGELKKIELELKLIADVGLIGFPNAGKSTLLSSLTKAKVKIAPYPFTTLSPNIGLIEEGFSKIFIADIPGIIKNAHLNKGLGISFLKHIERTSILIFVIDISASDGRDPIEDFEILQNELKAYSPEILKKPYLIVLNKIDIEESKDNVKTFKKKYSSLDILEISAINKDGTLELIKNIKELIEKNKLQESNLNQDEDSTLDLLNLIASS
jgi:GTPase